MTIATTTPFAAGNVDVEHQVDALRLRVRCIAHRFIRSGGGLDLRALEFWLFELMGGAVLQ